VISLQEFHNEVTAETYREPIEQIRHLKSNGDAETAEARKKSLPSVTPSGIFITRKITGLDRHSGLLCVDFDHCGASNKGRLAADKHSLLTFISPSGDGVKVFVKIDPHHHNESFKYAQNYYLEHYALTVDPKCSDVCRLCFMSYDPDAVLNLESVVLPFVVPPPEVTLHNVDTMNTQCRRIEDTMRGVGGRGAYTVDELIQRTIPSRHGLRHQQAFAFARGLKFNCGLPPLGSAQLKAYARQWHAKALYAMSTKWFDETWGDIMQGYRDATTPLGKSATAYDAAWARVKEGTVSTPEAENFEDPRIKNLVYLCYALRNASGEFFLSARTAGSLLGVSHTQANEWLTRLLCRQFRILECVKKGNSGEGASTYRWRGECPSVEAVA
jgi:hypothetical protein